MAKAVEVTHREFSTIRTGRASPALVEGIKVDYYGTSTPLKQLANISVPNPKLITIQPWDPSALESVEKAILKSSVGLTPNNDGKVIRLNMPELTKERREELVKLIKKIAEDGKVSMRTVRRDANESIKKMEKDNDITEDDKYDMQDEVQEMTDKYTKEIDTLLEHKEKELTQF
jgi:ribosome recycling factor